MSALFPLKSHPIAPMVRSLEGDGFDWWQARLQIPASVVVCPFCQHVGQGYRPFNKTGDLVCAKCRARISHMGRVPEDIACYTQEEPSWPATSGALSRVNSDALVQINLFVGEELEGTDPVAIAANLAREVRVLDLAFEKGLLNTQRFPKLFYKNRRAFLVEAMNELFYKNRRAFLVEAMNEAAKKIQVDAQESTKDEKDSSDMVKLECSNCLHEFDPGSLALSKLHTRDSDWPMYAVKCPNCEAPCVPYVNMPNLAGRSPTLASVIATAVHEIEGVAYFNWLRVSHSEHFNRLRIWCTSCRQYVRGRIANTKLVCEACDHVLFPARQVQPHRVVCWAHDSQPPAPHPVKPKKNAFDDITRATYYPSDHRPYTVIPLDDKPKPLDPEPRPATIRRFGSFGGGNQ